MVSAEEDSDSLRRRIVAEVHEAEIADARAIQAALHLAQLRNDPTTSADSINAAQEEAERTAINAALRTNDLHEAIEAAIRAQTE